MFGDETNVKILPGEDSPAVFYRVLRRALAGDGVRDGFDPSYSYLDENSPGAEMDARRAMWELAHMARRLWK